ncbi:MAG TPA: tetratricopeptide repeat protein, partial [Cyclobacteriaceae bacterium]|nr:tetratricopeptide repeat protein [Cyclobacteriaceae bacterium]
MRRIRLTFLLLIFAILANAQSSNISTLFQSNFKKAEYMYSRLAYRNALELYLAVAEKDSSNYAARQRAADCYFRLGNVDEAEKWYAALAISPDVPPVYKYKYAQVLSIQGKYVDAQKWFFEYARLTS